jgi:hypothetical protein
MAMMSRASRGELRDEAWVDGVKAGRCGEG